MRMNIEELIPAYQISIAVHPETGKECLRIGLKDKALEGCALEEIRANKSEILSWLRNEREERQRRAEAEMPRAGTWAIENVEETTLEIGDYQLVYRSSRDPATPWYLGHVYPKRKALAMLDILNSPTLRQYVTIDKSVNYEYSQRVWWDSCHGEIQAIKKKRHVGTMLMWERDVNDAVKIETKANFPA